MNAFVIAHNCSNIRSRTPQNAKPYTIGRFDCSALIRQQEHARLKNETVLQSRGAQ